MLKSIAALLLPAVAFGAEGVPTRNTLVAHEWGTFTSVAGLDGSSLRWTALSGPADLPCFVIRRDNHNIKVLFGALVRMETPVLYFYAPVPMALDVKVDFPKGAITEWYPAAFTDRGGQISWQKVELLPGANLELPTGTGASHYYAARQTDAAPLRIGQQREKLIFYRGIGDFQVPLLPRFTSDGKVEIRNSGNEPIAAAILFENRGGKLGYRVIDGLRGTAVVERPELTGDLESLRGRLADTLVELGLYRKEARAMVETWRDSWFEEGMRVLYMVPRATVDELLPIAIQPAPSGLARVFVGRVEMLSPEMETAITSAMGTGNVAVLEKYGRFLDAFVAQISEMRGHPPIAPQAKYFLQEKAEQAGREFFEPACVR
jgi:hypothetical protein